MATRSTLSGYARCWVLADPAALRSILEAVADQRAADALDALNDLVTAGADLRQLQQQLADEWRALLLARAGVDVVRVMERTEDEARALNDLANRFSLDELTGCARVFARMESPARGLPTPQLALELLLLECLAVRRNGGVQFKRSPFSSAPLRLPRHRELNRQPLLKRLRPCQRQHHLFQSNWIWRRSRARPGRMRASSPRLRGPRQSHHPQRHARASHQQRQFLLRHSRTAQAHRPCWRSRSVAGRTCARSANRAAPASPACSVPRALFR